MLNTPTSDELRSANETEESLSWRDLYWQTGPDHGTSQGSALRNGTRAALSPRKISAPEPGKMKQQEAKTRRRRIPEGGT